MKGSKSCAAKSYTGQSREQSLRIMKNCANNFFQRKRFILRATPRSHKSGGKRKKTPKVKHRVLFVSRL